MKKLRSSFEARKGHVQKLLRRTARNRASVRAIGVGDGRHVRGLRAGTPRAALEEVEHGKGVVAAVVETFGSGILAPVGTATVLGIELIADRPPRAGSPVSGVVEWLDDLAGEGQPVQNVAAAGGDTVDFCECRPLRLVFSVDDEAQSFIRGDSNNDGRHNIADAIWTVNAIFRGGPPSPCQHAADANGDGAEDLTDVIYTILHQFLGGAAPPAPYPNCGRNPADPTELACPPGSVPHCP
jgi:hypothetical protein